MNRFSPGGAVIYIISELTGVRYEYVQLVAVAMAITFTVCFLFRRR